MPHVIITKDGRPLTVFSITDVLDEVEKYAGKDLRTAVEKYINENIGDIADYEKEYDRMLTLRSILSAVREGVV